MLAVLCTCANWHETIYLDSLARYASFAGWRSCYMSFPSEDRLPGSAQSRRWACDIARGRVGAEHLYTPGFICDGAAGEHDLLGRMEAGLWQAGLKRPWKEQQHL